MKSVSRNACGFVKATVTTEVVRLQFKVDENFTEGDENGCISSVSSWCELAPACSPQTFLPAYPSHFLSFGGAQTYKPFSVFRQQYLWHYLLLLRTVAMNKVVGRGFEPATTGDRRAWYHARCRLHLLTCIHFLP